MSKLPRVKCETIMMMMMMMCKTVKHHSFYLRKEQPSSQEASMRNFLISVYNFVWQVKVDILFLLYTLPFTTLIVWHTFSGLL